MNDKLYLDKYTAKKYLIKLKRRQEDDVEFTLSLSEFKRIITKKKCFYTGVLMNKPIGETKQEWNDLTLDRIDSKKGYVSGNVVACTHSANSFKSILENPTIYITPKEAILIGSKTIELIGDFRADYRKVIK